MKKKTILLFKLLCIMNIYSQSDTLKIIDFSSVEKKLLVTANTTVNHPLNYDFKVVDSLHFYKNAFKKDLLTADYGRDFDLQMEDRKSILKFECKARVPQTCYQYVGYSKNAEVHIISKCRDVCELYLIDSYKGSTLSVPSEFDGGSYPVFLPGYMVLYASFYDNSFDDYYQYRSTIDIYEMKSTNDLEQKFNYIGSIHSKNWSIQEIYESNIKDSFLMKIYDEYNEFDYIEITIR